MRRTIPLLAATLSSALILAHSPARADPAAPAGALAVASNPAWSAGLPDLAARVRAARAIVLQVAIPLCSDQQIHCGGSWAGNPAGLRTNIYWGAIFGARTIFERSDLGWERVDVSPRALPMLEQAVYRRRVPGAAWGVDGEIEALVVLQAFHGAHIHHAVNTLWQTALAGGEVSFRDAGRDRREPITVAAYAGHNRLMDGLRLPPPPPSPRPIPSFVLACMSERHFGVPLRGSGSPTLLTSRAYMAPEGYVIDAVARAIAENRPAPEIRSAAVDATARWQRISRARADAVFAPPAR